MRHPLFKRALVGLLGVNLALWGSLAWLLNRQPTTAATIAPVPQPSTVHAPIPALRTALNGPARLPTGPLIVETFATWCKYCATTARWSDAADAAWAHHHHLAFVMTDVSPLGGTGHAAAAPTLTSIATTAYDGARLPLHTPAAEASAVRAFQATYHLALPIDFWVGGHLPQDWRIHSIPTFLLLNRQHQIIGSLAGYHTSQQFRAWAQTHLDAARH